MDEEAMDEERAAAEEKDRAEDRLARQTLQEYESRRAQYAAAESERRCMAREEERTLKVEETARRLMERRDRSFQETGHRLFLEAMGSLVRRPASVGRLQWVKALKHGAAWQDSLLAQCRDPASGKMVVLRWLVCQYDEDVEFALKQLRVHEDALGASCPFVMATQGLAVPTSAPKVNAATGLYGAATKAVMAVCNYCPGGQVADKCTRAHPVELSNDLVVSWAKDCAAGLRAMHAKGLTHRNLNPRNVHLDARGRAVLTGFQVLKNPRAPGDPYSLGRSDCGSAAVVAPEVEDGHPVTEKADVWALGCVLWAWVSGDPDSASALGAARDRNLEQLLRRVPRRFGPKVRAALRMTLQHHPDHRASALDLWKLLAAPPKK
mmetsp:Transcript_9070/g.20417  ORF Transcript_9070/g.20417 Transcript_9070/m.20417 type:complete len:379 (+) Transcript_9070:326-1462(+)